MGVPMKNIQISANLLRAVCNIATVFQFLSGLLQLVGEALDPGYKLLVAWAVLAACGAAEKVAAGRPFCLQSRQTLLYGAFVGLQVFRCFNLVRGQELCLSDESIQLDQVLTELPGDLFDSVRMLLDNPQYEAVSLLINNGTDIVSVSKRLGHARTSTTTNLYAHVIEKADEQATETLANAILRKKA